MQQKNRTIPGFCVLAVVLLGAASPYARAASGLYLDENFRPGQLEEGDAGEAAIFRAAASAPTKAPVDLNKALMDYDSSSKKILGQYGDIKENVGDCGVIGSRIAAAMPKAIRDQNAAQAKIDKTVKALLEMQVGQDAAALLQAAKKASTEVAAFLANGIQEYEANLSITSMGLEGGSETCEEGNQAYKAMGATSKIMLKQVQAIDAALAAKQKTLGSSI